MININEIIDEAKDGEEALNLVKKSIESNNT